MVDVCKQALKLGKAPQKNGNIWIYEDSFHQKDGGTYFILHGETAKSLVVIGGASFARFDGTSFDIDGTPAKNCPLSAANAKLLMEIFSFTAPRNHRGQSTTMGLGDRLGLASVGHIATVKDKPVFPVLAQQSIRELTLTSRTYDDVLAGAVFAVFECNYTDGYGADGDHLKTRKEVSYALDSGFTMITLDCSEEIDNAVSGWDKSQTDSAYAALPADVRSHYESLYAGRTFMVEDYKLDIGVDDLKSIVLTYHKAIRYTIDLYAELIAPYKRPVDFEMSIDETLSHTSPASHFIVASELIAGKVEITSLAPRFIGEFQKGIDYIGTLDSFDEDFKRHQQIARHLGYKLSVHSGSDKFMVFPTVGRETGLKVHVKTAGTNWLEAVRVIAKREPALYRRMHAYAREHLDEAKAYYHIKADINLVAPLDSVSDDKLPEYLNQDDARQMLHITYGLLLCAKKPDGSYDFKDEFFAALYKHEDEYISGLKAHIGKHVSLLGL